MNVFQVALILILSFSFAYASVDKEKLDDSTKTETVNMDESIKSKNTETFENSDEKNNLKISIKDIVSANSDNSYTNQMLEMEKNQIVSQLSKNSNNLTSLNTTEKGVTLTIEKSLNTDDIIKKDENNTDKNLNKMLALENDFNFIHESKKRSILNKNFFNSDTETRFDRIEKILFVVLISIFLLIGFVLYDRFKREGYVNNEIMQQLNESKTILKKLSAIIIEYSEIEPELEDILKKEKLMQSLIQLD